MKNKLTLLILGLGLLAACGQKADKQYEEETIELEQVQEELDEVQETIQSETEDLNHDVDSLLEGI